ncbi:NUDIX hydrolase [Patescibacteria group bacterium]|nr:NUDIX hydrolase [Patescibacteria group bacterium]
MQKFIPSVAVLIIKGKKVLLVESGEESNHETGIFGLPSGIVEKGESEDEAAVRELAEETGLITNLDDLVEFSGNFYIASIKRKDGSKKTFAWRVFLCKNYSGGLRTTKESIPKWVHIEKMDNFYLLPNIKNATISALKFLENET